MKNVDSQKFKDGRIMNTGFKKPIFEELVNFYNSLHKTAQKKIDTIIDSDSKTAAQLDMKLAEKSIFALEDAMVEDMHHKGIISKNLHMRFKQEIAGEFYSDVKEDLDGFDKTSDK